MPLPSFPVGYSAPSLSWSKQHSHFLLVKQLKLVLGVCLKHLANWASSYPVRLRIFQRKKFWGWQQRVIFACPTAAFKEQTSLFFPFLITTSSMHICIFATNVLIQTDNSPSSLTGLLAMEPCCFSVRRRKLSCDRRDCEAGCWRFICSGGTAEVAGVKLLHLLAPKVLRNLVKCQFLRDSDAEKKCIRGI